MDSVDYWGVNFPLPLSAVDMLISSNAEQPKGMDGLINRKANYI